MKKGEESAGKLQRFAYAGLDRVIHERARLGVLTSLLAHPQGLAFRALKQLCGLTDGNLCRHLQVLEEAKLINVARNSESNRQQTLYRISTQGRKRYIDYLVVLQQVVLDGAVAMKVDSDGKGAQALARS